MTELNAPAPVTMTPVARIHTDFSTKFGIPRQSGLVSALEAYIVFEPEYRVMEAVRGMDEYTHLWLLWHISEMPGEKWSPTVRPPRLGGNVRMGVFATRSPFRPNPIGLSSVRLLRVDRDSPLSPVIHVAGADLMDGTPILDIKPYVPYSDCHADASGGFTDKVRFHSVAVSFPPELLERVPKEKREALTGVLAGDPRPSYQDDPERIYGFGFAGLEVRFSVRDELLTVVDVQQV